VVPDNVPTIDHAFSDRYTAEQFLGTCYWGLPKSGEIELNPGYFGAMETCYNPEYEEMGAMQFGLGNDNPASPKMNYWSNKSDWLRSLHAGIRDCNTFMDNINNVQDIPPATKARMFDETKLLKAYYHFYLLSLYGPICPLRENTPVNESTQGVRAHREKIDDCFAYILELINDVIGNKALPEIIQNETSELGRLTLPAAYFLKAKVLTYWASPLFNGNTDYSSFLNHEGEPFFNQNYIAERWSDAAEACREAISVCDNAGARLFQSSDYVKPRAMSDSTLIVQTLRATISQRWNKELVWGNTTSSVTWGFQFECLPRLENGTAVSTRSRLSVPFSHVDRFYSKNGVPIDEDTDYDYEGRFGTRVGDADHRYYIQLGETTASMNFEREPRFYSTLGFDRGKWYGNHYNNTPSDDAQCLYPKARYGEYSSVFQPGEYNVTGYYVKKMVSINTVWRDANSVTLENFPFPEMRFADLLLLYAETLNESKSAPDSEVYRYIDMVRERAGLKGVVESWMKFSNNPEKPSTKTGMRRIIQRERSIELACEGAYYWDARRWKTAMSEQNKPVQGWNVLADDVDEYYTVTTIYPRRFAFKQYLFPIPDSEMLSNPALIQNPGW